MPENAKPAQDLADFLAESGHEEGASHWLHECIKRDKHNTHCALKLGLMHVRSGRHGAAISLLERSVKLQPSRQAFNGLGVAYFHTKQADLALLAYASAIAADDGIVANTVAVLVNAAGAVLSHDAALAVRVYTAAVRCKRTHAQARFGLGRALLWLTPPKAKAAVLHLGHSIRLDPSLTQVAPFTCASARALTTRPIPHPHAGLCAFFACSQGVGWSWQCSCCSARAAAARETGKFGCCME
jgi:tetratricopeptide (TPR) repeat protein